MNEHELVRKVIQTYSRDIAGMLLIRPSIDRSYLNEWAAKLGVSHEWELVRKRVDETAP